LWRVWEDGAGGWRTEVRRYKVNIYVNVAARRKCFAGLQVSLYLAAQVIPHRD
jgi:hypothetical protein